MLRWLLRIGLGYLVVRLAEAYRRPAGDAPVRAKRRKRPARPAR